MSELSKFYDKKKSEMIIRRRYKNCIPSIRLTLKKIIPTNQFQSIKISLRSKGWKDWHILMGLFNYIMNYRMERLGILGNIKEMIKFQQIYLYQEEDDNNIQIPIDNLTESNIKRGLETSMLATLQAFGFNVPLYKTIDITKIKNILNKFNYWEDDVDHNLLFDKKLKKIKFE